MRPLMPNWMLNCAHCNASFVHSEVVAASFYDPFYLPPKSSLPRRRYQPHMPPLQDLICLSAFSTHILRFTLKGL